MITKKRRLGKTGFDISLTGFGAWAIGNGSYGNVREEVAIETIKEYVNQGGNHIDTAQGYADSERLIGKALTGGFGDGVILATKTGNEGTKETIHLVREALEHTRMMLQRDCIDVYYMHSPPAVEDDRKRLFDEYEALRAEGKIKYIGASIKGVDVTQDTVDLCETYILEGRVDVIQLVYSIFRQKNEAIFELAKKHDVGIVGRTAMESGFLTGKYKKDHVFPSSDHRSRWTKEKLDLILSEAENLNAFCEKTSFDTLAQLAVKFAMQNTGIDSVIIGAKSKTQMEANCKIELLSDLTIEEIKYLKERYGDFTENCNTV